MKCNHCGLCCSDPCTQINLTIGDIKRISDFLKIPVEDLFKEHMSVKPFADPDFIHYDMDLGLELPCRFRIDERCSVYPVRPLNCRLFPYWVLAEAPPDRLKDIFSEHACSYDMLRKKDYQRYKEIVGNILLDESKFLRIDKRINISRMDGFENIQEENFRKKEQKKIDFIKDKVKVKLNLEDIKQAINNNKDKIEGNKIELEKAEKILK